MTLASDGERLATRRQLGRAAASGIAWGYTSYVLSKLLIFTSTVILARLLLPEAFGIVGFALIVIGYLDIARDLGVGSALIARPEVRERDASMAFFISVAWGVALTACVYLAAPLFGQFFGDPRAVDVTRVLAFSFLLSWDFQARVLCSVLNHHHRAPVFRGLIALGIVCLLQVFQQPALAGTGYSQLPAVVARANRTAPAYFPVFTPDSRWNTPLFGDEAVDSNSGLYLGTLDWAIERHGSLAINVDQYTVPIWYADSTTPRYKVWCTAGWGCGPGFGDDVPIPDEAQFDPAGDGHMVVIDVERQLSYEFWRAWRGNSGWYAGFGIVFNTQADPAGEYPYFGGVLDPVGHQFGAWSPSARASGVSLLGGLIRYGELSAGRIDHALAFSFPYTRGDAYALPMATHSDNVHTADRIAEHNLPLGAHLRLRPDINVDERCWGNPSCIAVGRALQEYGMYLVDTSYRTTLYAEGLYGKDVSWEGLLGPHDATSFSAYDFEVLALPELTSAP